MYRNGGRVLKGSRSPTSMTNSNPSRFFISSTKYLGIKGEKARMAEAGKQKRPTEAPKNLEGNEIWGPPTPTG